MVISYADTDEGVTPDMLQGFFVGWPKPPGPEIHLKLLRESYRVVLAVDDETGRVVGFTTAISDGVLSAHITLLEVLPAYQGQGIGRELMRRVLDQLGDLYAVDLICDPETQSFYARCGMTPASAMMIRNYDVQSGSGERAPWGQSRLKGVDSGSGGIMLAELSFREASPADASTVVRLLRRMLDEMASVGGHAVERSVEAWTRFGEATATEIVADDHLFLLAKSAGTSLVPFGLAHASVVTREVVFEPTRVLHIHALYVRRDRRRRGIGRALLQATIGWGRARDCTEAELSVLAGNPARKLYEVLGFSAFEMDMVRRL